MKAYVFPGQGAQFTGMGQDLFERYKEAKDLFYQANEILGFDIAQIMFTGTEEDLRKTDVTQPAVFLHSVILTRLLGEAFEPAMVAGHSLGEFSALVTSGALTFEDGLKLVAKRANAMQKACEATPSTMAAILGLADNVVDQICSDVKSGIVVPANYNCPGQLVISGEFKAVEEACELLKAAGALKTVMLSVGGAFHSPLMAPAKIELQNAILDTKFNKPLCPIFQNIDAKAYTDPEQIKENLINQLTGAVRWTQTVENMIEKGATAFIEVGPGKVLQGLVKKVNRAMSTESAVV